MVTSDARVSNRASLWPRYLTSGELSRLVRRHGVAVSAESPIRSLINDEAAPSDPGEATTASSVSLDVAVSVLAAPRQLLVLSLTDYRGGLLLFANDGEHIVRFGVGADGCTVFKPCSHRTFVGLIVRLAGADAAGEGPTDSVFVSRHFLETVGALRAAGLFSRPAASIPIASARAAVDSVMGGDAQHLDRLLLALQEDGVLIVSGTTVEPSEAWMREHPYLFGSAALKMRAIELADLDAGTQSLKSLAVLGERGCERVVFVPAAAKAGDDDLLQLCRVSPGSIAEALLQLLAPPLAPPSTPVAGCGGDSRLWIADAAQAESPADWSCDTLEALLLDASGSSQLPPALFSPGATVEILSGSRGRAGVERCVFAFDTESAVQWRLDGSRVRWRQLSSADAAACFRCGLAHGCPRAGPRCHARARARSAAPPLRVAFLPRLGRPEHSAATPSPGHGWQRSVVLGACESVRW